MPGAAITVRTLMFVGGAVGVLLGLLFCCVTMMSLLDEELARTFLEGDRPNTAMSGAEGARFFGLLGAITLLYGVPSLLLASRMRDRDTAALWSVVGFQVLAALVLVVFMALGRDGLLVPLLFAVGMNGLMLTPRVRDYYGL